MNPPAIPSSFAFKAFAFSALEETRFVETLNNRWKCVFSDLKWFGLLHPSSVFWFCCFCFMKGRYGVWLLIVTKYRPNNTRIGWPHKRPKWWVFQAATQQRKSIIFDVIKIKLKWKSNLKICKNKIQKKMSGKKSISWELTKRYDRSHSYSFLKQPLALNVILRVLI